MGIASPEDVLVPLVAAVEAEPDVEADMEPEVVAVVSVAAPEPVPVTFVPSVVGKLAPLGTSSVVSMGGKVCSGGWPVGGGDAFWAMAPIAKAMRSEAFIITVKFEELLWFVGSM